MPDQTELPRPPEPINEKGRKKFIKEIRQLSEDTQFPSGFSPVVFDIPDMDDWEISPEDEIVNELRTYYDYNKPVHVILIREDYDEVDAAHILRQVFGSPEEQPDSPVDTTMHPIIPDDRSDIEEQDEIWEQVNTTGLLTGALSYAGLEEKEKRLKSINNPGAVKIAKFLKKVTRFDQVLTDLYRHNHPTQITSSVGTFFFLNDPPHLSDEKELA